MDVNSIVQIISAVGFPIVAAGALFWYVVTDSRDMRKVVENNTLALTKVLEHISSEEDRKDGT